MLKYFIFIIYFIIFSRALRYQLREDAERLVKVSGPKPASLLA